MKTFCNDGIFALCLLSTAVKMMFVLLFCQCYDYPYAYARQMHAQVPYSYACYAYFEVLFCQTINKL